MNGRKVSYNVYVANAESLLYNVRLLYGENLTYITFLFGIIIELLKFALPEYCPIIKYFRSLISRFLENLFQVLAEHANICTQSLRI